MKNRHRSHLLFLVIFIHSLLFCCHANAQQLVTDSIERPKFILALSGGGARGLSQIGVLKALDETGLKPDMIVGTSMGAIVGSLYASGCSPDSILRIAKAVDWGAVFSNSAKRKKLFVSQKDEPINYLFEIRLNDRLEMIPPSSISHGQAFFDLLSPLLAPAEFQARMNFDSFPVPLRIVATDLLSGRRVIFRSGNLATAIRASCGVPLAFSPVRRDGMLLMDGGLVENIPIETAREQGGGLVVAVDVTSPLWKQADLDNPVRLMDQVVAIGKKPQRDVNRQNADLVITPELDGFNNTDFRTIDTLVSRGYNMAMRYADTLRRLFPPGPQRGMYRAGKTEWSDAGTLLAERIDSLMRADTGNARNFSAAAHQALQKLGYSFGRVKVLSSDSTRVMATLDTGAVSGIAVTGNGKTATDLIVTAAGIHKGRPFSSTDLHRAMSAIYATNLFNNVNIDLDTSRAVRIMVEEKKYWRVRMGLRYDEFHLGEGFAQPAYENLFGRGMVALMHLQYGLRREKYALEIQHNNLLTTNFSSSAKIQTYLSHERIFRDTVSVDSSMGNPPTETLLHREKSLRKSGVLGLLGVQVGRAAMLSGGLHLEFYKVQEKATSAFRDVWGQKFLPYALLQLNIDNLDRFPFPTSGWKLFQGISGTSRAIGGKNDFFKFDGSAYRAFSLHKKHIFASQVRFSWASSPLPEVEQLYIGGAFPEETLKNMEIYKYIPFFGMPPRALSGDVMGLVHGGYSFKVNRNFYLTAGVDCGYAWDYDDFSWEPAGHDFLTRAPVGIGAGFALETIAGPIRLTWGRLVHNFAQSAMPADNHLYFSIGHDF